MTACHSFPPIVNEEARVLILGSMPSVISLRQHQYYANPHNQFWAIIYTVLGLPVPSSYDQRTEGLKGAGIALWDVLAFCERQGSLDAGIKEEFPNNIIDFLKRYPSIKMVAFNGTKARDMWKKHIGPDCDRPIEFHTLPSTSPALAKPFEYKLAKWMVINAE